MNPPDLRSNTQRVFVPREALTSVTVLAVIGAANRRRKGGQPDTRQVTLFEQ
jgi:succinylarginine dihydrolase